MTLQAPDAEAAQQGEPDGPRLSVLMSPATYPEPQLLKAFRPDWDILFDSGAFTNFRTGKEVITLDWLVGFLTEHRENFWRYFNLDKIGDHAASDVNLGKMQEAGLDPIPVLQRGASAEQLAEMLAAHSMIGVGGIAGQLNKPGDREYLHNVMRLVGDQRSKVHLLGVGQQSLLQMYKPYSADCSTCAGARMFGELKLWDGFGWTAFKKARVEAARATYIRPDPKRTSILHSYGLTWEVMGLPESWRGDGICVTTGIRAWIRYGDALRRRFGIRLFLVDHRRIHNALVLAWEAEKELLSA